MLINPEDDDVEKVILPQLMWVSAPVGSCNNDLEFECYYIVMVIKVA